MEKGLMVNFKRGWPELSSGQHIEINRLRLKQGENPTKNSE